jgi:hypothetical protein
MAPHDTETKARMTANLADFLELLSLTRGRIIETRQTPTEIPTDLEEALLRLISE